MACRATERFELLRQVGAGGSGLVHEARDTVDGSPAAVKVLLATSALGESRFEREASLLAQLRHPSIVRYLAHGRTTGGDAYLAMEWLEGETLEAKLQAGPLSVDDVLTLGLRIVAGLVEADRLGIVHRDLKPANLFLVSGRVSETKILDFGLARRVDDADARGHTQTGVAIGTPHYMSPEQARGEPDLSTASDMFSLGCILYEGLTGTRPFAATHALATLMMICVDEPVRVTSLPPFVPVLLADLVHAMLSKQPASRPTPACAASELEHLRTNTGDDASPAASPEFSLSAATGSGPSRESLAPGFAQRVLSAVFMRGGARASVEHEEQLRGLLTTYGARTERLRDGSRILMFDSHVTAGEQVLAAARCALACCELLGEVSTVVCTGRALVDGKLPLGDLIERGARLLGEAPPRLVRVDEASAALLDARFQLGYDGGLRTLKRERIGGEAPRTVLGRVTPFVGRDRELDRLTRLCGECVVDSVARATLVIGPAGAGKSRLRYELVQCLQAADSGFTLLMAHGDAMRVATPFGVLAPALHAWAQISSSDTLSAKRLKLLKCVQSVLPTERGATVAHFLGELAAVPFADEEAPDLCAARRDPQLMADRVLSSFLEWLEALSADGPVAFLVEDLHWADPASVRLLDTALGTLEGRPFLVLAFARPEVRDAFPKLWVDRDLVEMRLSRLGAKACEQLLEAIGRAELSASTQAWLIERAEGNPFFLEELVRGLRSHSGDHSTLPDTIVGIIQTRLDALGEGAKLLIRAASVFGQAFRVDAAEALLGERATRLDVAGWLRLLTDREVIFARGEPSAREYVFRHALIRDAAYALLADEERTLGHRLAAQWLAGQSRIEPALLADHFERGAVFERAAHWYGAAAAAALDASSMAEVVRCGERAVACGASGAPLGEVASLVAEAASYGGDDGTAVEWAALASQHAPVATAPWWRASQVLSIGHFREGNSPAAVAVAEAMIAHASPLSPVPAEVAALAHTAHGSLLYLQNGSLGPRLLSLLPDAAFEPLGARVEALVHGARACAAILAGDFAEALRRGRVTVEVVRRAGASRDLVQQLTNCAWVLTECGVYEEAEERLVEAIQLGRRFGLWAYVGVALQNLGLLHLHRGQIDEALPLMRDALDAFLDLGLRAEESLAWSCVARATLQAGDLDAGAGPVEKALQLAGDEPAALAAGLTMSAWLDLLRRRPTEASLTAGEALALSRDRPFLDHRALTRVVYVESLIMGGHLDEARAALSDGRLWLAARAAKIDDEGVRRSFLSKVPDNGRLVELAAHWLDGGS